MRGPAKDGAGTGNAATLSSSVGETVDFVPPVSPADRLITSATADLGQAASAAARAPTAEPAQAGSQALSQSDSQSDSRGRHPSRIGRYVIIRHLGQGSMGVVYAAYDPELDRKVAVKLLHESALTSSSRRARIIGEAQAMARVSHPNVVHVYEVGEATGQVFVAMEFIEGTTLSTWQKQDQRTWEEVLRIYLAAGKGLLAAHSAGLVHRDFKPDNVLIGADNDARVADFGLARAVRRTGPEEVDEPGVAAAISVQLPATPLTLEGALLGTPAYMSPEQFAGKATDGRSDQFSFCAALYQALYRQLPFEGNSIKELSENVSSGQIAAVPSPTQVPALTEQTLRRGLSVDPEQRFPSMAELLAALDIDPQHDPAAAPQLGRAFGAAMLGTGCLLSASIGFSLNHRPPSSEHLFRAAVVLLFVAMSMAFFLRGALRRRQFHRGLVKMVIIWTAQLAGLRGIGLLLGLSLAQEGAMELGATAGLLATASVHYLPALWPMTAVYTVAALLIPLYPDAAWEIVGVLYPALGLYFLSALSRVAGQVAPRAPVTRLRQRQIRRQRIIDPQA